MSDESKEPKFTVSQSWKELSEWEKANDVLIYGYLDAQEILEHFEGHEGWQYNDKNAILEAMRYAWDKSEIEWTTDYLNHYRLFSRYEGVPSRVWLLVWI